MARTPLYGDPFALMLTRMADPVTVDEYLAKIPEPYRQALVRLRAIIRAAAPAATERISYGIPSYRLGRPLVSFGAFKNHCSLFGMSGYLYDRLGEAAKAWRTSRGTIQFTPDHPLPEALVRKIIEFRIDEIKGKAANKTARKTEKSA